jgi:hypothetical protein
MRCMDGEGEGIGPALQRWVTRAGGFGKLGGSGEFEFIQFCIRVQKGWTNRSISPSVHLKIWEVWS